jgi:hypothetical protein
VCGSSNDRRGYLIGGRLDPTQGYERNFWSAA